MTTRPFPLRPLLRSTTALVGVIMLGSTPAHSTDIVINTQDEPALNLNNGDTLLVTGSGSISPFVNPFSGHAVTLSGSVTGAITNDGVIESNDGDGIHLKSNADIAGGLVNTGTIAGGAGGRGIASHGTGGTISGGLTNSGWIVAVSPGSQEAVRLYGETGSTFGAINNSGTIQGSAGGLFLGGLANTYGAITNSGTIDGAPFGAGIYLFSAADIAGGIDNSGTISGNVGIASDASGVAISGGLTNSGVINGTSLDGVSLQGNTPGSTFGTIVNVNSGTISGADQGIFLAIGTYAGVTNDGAISGGNYGIRTGNQVTLSSLLNSGTITGSTGGVSLLEDFANVGTISNSGTISGTSGYGFILGEGAGENIVISGGIDNSGTIEGTVMAIYSDGASISGGLNNSGTIQSSFGTAIGLYGDGLVDEFTNSGTISGGAAGIYLSNNTNISDGLNNSGTISGGSDGIFLILNSQISNGLTNSGTISGGSDGINLLDNASISGGLTNSVTISGGNTGIYLEAFSGILGGLTNSGTISGGGSQGILLSTNASITGGIDNAGTISGGTAGINLANNSQIQDGLNNSGTISGGSEGILLSSNGSITGGIDNSGTISGNQGVVFSDNSQIHDGLNNSGTISGALQGIYLLDNASLSGGLTNSGDISGGGQGIWLADSEIVGGLTNSGTISGNSEAIWLSGNSEIQGGLTNSGDIVGGVFGIDVYTNASITGGIDNSGTITGVNRGIFLRGTLSGDLVNLTGGSISGGDEGVRFGADAYVFGNVVNQGEITGGTYGMFVDGQTFSGSILNTGTISGGTGVFVQAPSGDITNNGGIIEGTSGPAIDITPPAGGPITLTLNGGRVIGDIIDRDFTGGNGTIVGITGDFATEGDITVGRLFVNGGNTFTIAAGDTVELHQTQPGGVGGTLRFGVASNSSFGRLLVDEASHGYWLDLNNTSLAVTYTGGTLAVGNELRIATSGDPIVGGPGGTPTLVSDNSFLWQFHAVDGTGIAAPTDDTELYLIVSRNSDVVYSSKGNQGAADAILGLGGSSDPQIQQVVSNLNTADSQAGLNAVAESVQPGVDGSTFTTSQNFATRTFGLVDSRLASVGNAGGSGVSSSFSASDMNWFAHNGNTEMMLAALRPESGGQKSTKLGVGNSSLRASGHSVWVQAFGQTIRQQEREGFAGYRANTGGVAFGMDTADLYADTIFGAAFSYGDTQIKSRNVNDTLTSIDNYQFAMYGNHRFSDDMYLRGMAAYGRNDVDTQRRNVGGVTGLTARGEYKVDQFSAQAEVGKDIDLGGATVTPHALTAFTHYRPDDYTETGAGGANLTVNQKAVNNLDIGVGLNARATYELEGEATLTPEIRTGVRYSVIRDDLEATSTFTAGGASFASQGPTLPRASANIGTGLTYSPNAEMDVKVSYEYQVKDDYQAHSGYLMTSFRF